MSDLENTLRREARSHWQGISPDPAFTERLVGKVTSDIEGRAAGRSRFWSRLALVGFVASMLVAVAFPGARVAATNAIRQVFHIGGVEFVVNSGSDPVPPVQVPEMKELDPRPDSNNRWFYTPSGPLPTEGLAAVKALGDQFRVPAWLPEDLPKRLQLPLEAYNGDPFYGLAVGTHIFISAESPGYGLLEFRDTTERHAQRVLLGDIEALEVQQGSETSYYFSIGNVKYEVMAPTTEKEVVRKIAESLSAPDR